MISSTSLISSSNQSLPTCEFLDFTTANFSLCSTLTDRGCSDSDGGSITAVFAQQATLGRIFLQGRSGDWDSSGFLQLVRVFVFEDLEGSEFVIGGLRGADRGCHPHPLLIGGVVRGRSGIDILSFNI